MQELHLLYNTQSAMCLQYTVIVAVRLGRQVKTFQKAGNGSKRTILLWWTDRIEQSSVFESDTNASINTTAVVGEDWER